MRTVLIIGLLALGIATPAAAHDSTFRWHGFYVGLNAGYAWSDYDVRLAPNDLFFNSGFPADGIAGNFMIANGARTISTDAITAGGQLGFNLQSGGLVLGLEVDLNATGLKKRSVRGDFVDGGGTTHRYDQTAETPHFLTVRPRIGFAFDHRVLGYVTGGLVVGESEVTGIIVNNNTPNLTYAGSRDQLTIGWTVGGGAEIALSDRWSVKLEYLHVDLGDVRFRAPQDGLPLLFWVNHKTDIAADIVRGGVNYRF